MDEVMDVTAAAKMLGVSEQSVRNYVDRGILRRLGEGNKILISLQDVASASSLLARCFDFVYVARTALKALVSSTRAERRLERVEMLLGIDATVLSVEEDEVLAFYKRCKDTLLDYTEDLRAADVLDWAYRLAAVTEEYLHLVTFYTGEEEPWVPFMEVAQKLAESAPKDKFTRHKDLEIAYAYVASSRRHLRQVAYFYIRGKYGKKVANGAFPEVTDGERDDKIIDLLLQKT